MTCSHDMIRQLTGGTCPVCPPEPPKPEPRKISDAQYSALISITPTQRLAEQCKRSFSRFFREGWSAIEAGTKLEWKWYLDVICDHLQALVMDWIRAENDYKFTQRFNNLLITIPPGFLKSRLLSYLVPWAWLHEPKLRAICLSCNPKVAGRDSVIARDLIRSDWYQNLFRPDWEIRRDVDGKEKFQNTAGGWRQAQGLDAQIVGERGDLIVVDDPHDPDDVNSEVQRLAVIERYANSIDNRVNNAIRSIRVGICQKTHVEDWAAWAEEHGWVRINLPLLYDGVRRSSPLGEYDQRTEEDECLHPERFPPQAVEHERSKGEFRFVTQYQQAPFAREGGIFKYSWFKFYDEQPQNFEDIVISVDCAAKKTLKGSNTAIGAVARKGPDRFVLEVWKGKISLRETVKRIKEMRERWHARKVIVEMKAMGPDVVEELRRDIPGIVEIEVGTDKESRATAVQGYVEGGNVALPRGAPWVEEFLAEVCAFPAGKRDDQVDVFTQALNYFRTPSSYATKMKALGLRTEQGKVG
jgi:predicted phage terminase large subunit-like protein